MLRIEVVKGYENIDEIYAFMESAFDQDKDIAAYLHNNNPNRHVVVKPNWVQEAHEFEPDIWEPVITHPLIVLAAVETLARIMNGRGKIAICDAPQTYANFTSIVARGALDVNLQKLKQNWPELQLELLDLRREVWIRKDEVVIARYHNPEDPRGYVRVNLQEDSLFFGHHGQGRYYGADYDVNEVNSHHAGDVQEYLIAGTPIVCDLFVNLPKMKTHKKTGLTCCLKNLVGINGDKNWLPHHTEGDPSNHGDEFPIRSWNYRVESGVKRFGKKSTLRLPSIGTWSYRQLRNIGKRLLGDSAKVIRNGNWSGNDTCWRMALDLNRALLFANVDGSWRECFQPKPYLAIVDGIIGGEGNGPLCPEPVQSNVLVTGTNPAEVDAVVAKLMGFDPIKIPIIKHAFDAHRFPISTLKMEEIKVRDMRVENEIPLEQVSPVVEGGFEPHFGWREIQEK